MVKNLPAMQETWLWSLGEEDSPEKRLVTHSSVLDWRIPWIEEPGRLQSVGLPRVRLGWANLGSTLRSGSMTKKEIPLPFRLAFWCSFQTGLEANSILYPSSSLKPSQSSGPPCSTTYTKFWRKSDTTKWPAVWTKSWEQKRDPVDGGVGNVVSRYSREQRKSKGPRQEDWVNLKAILDTCAWLIIRKKWPMFYPSKYSVHFSHSVMSNSATA